LNPLLASAKENDFPILEVGLVIITYDGRSPLRNWLIWKKSVGEGERNTLVPGMRMW